MENLFLLNTVLVIIICGIILKLGNFILVIYTKKKNTNKNVVVKVIMKKKIIMDIMDIHYHLWFNNNRNVIIVYNDIDNIYFNI